MQIRNCSTEQLSLAGWKLQNKIKKDFKFPEIQLGPGESLTVWTGEGSKKKQKFPTDLAWSTCSWNIDGDCAELLNPRGEIEAKVDVLPSI